MRKPIQLWTRNPAFALVALSLALVPLLSCSPKSTSQDAGPFPETGEVPGWTKSGAVRTFPAENLWEYIDGDAERYTQAGVVTTMTADYRFKDKTDAVVDVHVMTSPEGPKELLKTEWSGEGQRVPVGDDARLFATSLVFRKGRHLVRLTAYEQSPEIGEALVALGEAIDKKLGAAGRGTA